jgi:hypothetical protein
LRNGIDRARFHRDQRGGFRSSLSAGRAQADGPSNATMPSQRKRPAFAGRLQK